MNYHENVRTDSIIFEWYPSTHTMPLYILIYYYYNDIHTFNIDYRIKCGDKISQK